MNKADQNRSTYRARLASLWLKSKQPQIWREIERLAELKFPRTTKYRGKTILPKELEAMEAKQP